MKVNRIGFLYRIGVLIVGFILIVPAEYYGKEEILIYYCISYI